MSERFGYGRIWGSRHTAIAIGKGAQRRADAAGGHGRAERDAAEAFHEASERRPRRRRRGGRKPRAPK